MDSSSLRLTVPNNVFRDWISTNYFDVIEESLEELHMSGYRVEFLLEDSRLSASMSAGANPNPAKAERPLTPLPRPSQGSTTTKPSVAEPSELPLNSKYKFDTFVVGSCNQFAHAASRAVVDMPAKTYNPLYLYGGVGLGKTI